MFVLFCTNTKTKIVLEWGPNDTESHVMASTGFKCRSSFIMNLYHHL